MLKIRLQRVGRKHQPIFRVVLTDARNSTKSGKTLETLGLFDHTTHTKRVDAERIKHWLSKGAQPSVTLHNYFISEKIIEGKKKNALPKHRPIKKEEKIPEPSPTSDVGIVAPTSDVVASSTTRRMPADEAGEGGRTSGVKDETAPAEKALEPAVASA